MRVAFKSIVDFTALLHGRHPYELGGSYWVFTLLSTPVICFIFGLRYLEYVESDAGKARDLEMVLDKVQVYRLIGGLIFIQATALFVFLQTINKEYIYTFYSTRTGNENAMGFFTKHDDAERKIDVFGESRWKWKDIEGGVVEWVNLKIPEWNESQSEWWDARREALIPDWAVRDTEALKSIRSTDVIKVQDERRGSFGGGVIGGGENGGEAVGEDAGTIRRRSLLVEAKRELNKNA